MQVHYYNELWAKYFTESDKPQGLPKSGPALGGPSPDLELIGGVLCCLRFVQSPALMSRTR